MTSHQSSVVTSVSSVGSCHFQTIAKRTQNRKARCIVVRLVRAVTDKISDQRRLLNKINCVRPMPNLYRGRYRAPRRNMAMSNFLLHWNQLSAKGILQTDKLTGIQLNL